MRYTTETYINKCIEIHGNRYDYSLVNYSGFKNKIIIICKKHGEFTQRAQSHLNGQNCNKCYISFRNITHNEFLEQSNKIHNNKYDYTNTIFISSKKKIKIKCIKHGEFEQLACNHLKGQGCAKCAHEEHRITQSEFIEKSNIIHENRYDYNLVQYINHSSNVDIICKTHGIFKQTPNNHMTYKKGCPKCNGGIKYELIDFIEKSTCTHGGKYDYSFIKYNGSLSKVNILCKKHGIFEQTPSAHFKGQGCPICAVESRKLTKNEFIKKSNDIHKNKYDYSLVTYINSTTKIIIKCSCGFTFLQTPRNHLSGQGCPKCSSKNISKNEIKWLDLIGIPNEYRHKTIKIDNINFYVDAFNPENNTVYEFYGDYWHGNPNKYNPEDFNKTNNIKYKDLYIKTIQKEKKLIENNYKIISIWESEFKNNNKRL